MKRFTIAAASLALCAVAFTSCGPSKKDIKTAIVKQCNEGSAKQFTDPKLLSMMKEYCECAGDKAAEKLSVSEFKDFNKMQKEGREAEMQAKMMPIIQPCLNDMEEKMKKQQMSGAQ